MRRCIGNIFGSPWKIVESMEGFHSLGHLDYAVRYGYDRGRGYSYGKYAELIDEILKTLIRKDIALEVNTGGPPIRAGIPQSPSGCAERYRELGGEMVTLGSGRPCSLGNGIRLYGSGASAEGSRLRKRDRIPAGKAGGDTVIICPKPLF